MLKLTLRNIRGRKLRYALTTFAVVLGVAFLSTSFFLTDQIRETFDDLALDRVGETDLAVRASFGDGDRRNQLPIPAELAKVVTSDIPGVATVEASIFAFGVVPLYVEDGTPKAVTSLGPNLGLNFNGVDGFNNIWVVKGRAPEHVASPDGEEVVGEFALATNVAEDHDFAVGETYTVSAPSGNRDFTLVGLVHWGSAHENKSVGATFTVFDNWTAQEFLNRQGRYDSLSVLLEPEADRAEVATLIQAEIDAAVAEFKLMVWLLPEEEQQAYTALDSIELEVVTSDVLVEENKSDFDLFLSIFSTVLLVFAVIAVLVSAFIINNTFTIVIGQRIRELGLLRSLGATGRQISRSVRTEALIIGAVATVIGLISGYLLATLLRWVLSKYGFGNITGGIPVRPRTVLVATIVGVGSTLLSSLGPSNKVRSITPVEALREGAGFTPTDMTRRLLVGSGVTMVGVALLAVGMLTNLGTSSLLTALGAGALVTFVGVYLLSPVIARPVVQFLVDEGQLDGIDKIPGRLARENAGRSPRRTAATAAALTVGLALVSLAAVVGDSAKATVNQILDDSVEADLFVRGPTDITGFPNELNERIRDVAEQRPDLIESSIGYRFGFSAIEVEGSRKAVASADLDTLSGHMDLGLVEGDPNRYDSNGLLVHVDPAADLGLEIGTQLTVGFQGGQETVLTVAAIFEDAALLGNWVVDNSTIKEYLPQAQDVFVSVLYPPGADQAVSRAAVEAVAADYPQASMEDRDEFRENMSARLDRVLVVINVLLALSLLIAVLGITNTLALSVYERTRELGLLRAVGMTRRQLRQMVSWEAVIIALFGGILGLAIGVLFGIAAIAAMPEAFIRVTSVPTMTLLVYLGVAGLFGVAAAIFPARRAARLDILEAISYE